MVHNANKLKLVLLQNLPLLSKVHSCQINNNNSKIKKDFINDWNNFTMIRELQNVKRFHDEQWIRNINYIKVPMVLRDKTEFFMTDF